MADHHEDEFALYLSDLPEAARDEIEDTVRRFTIPIIVDNTALGSGTLVKIDDRYGILTAEHVVRHPTRPELRLDCPAVWPPRFLNTTVAEYPHELRIETFALRIVTTGNRVSNQFGPDLAFIELPHSAMLSELRAKMSFTDLTIEPERKTKQAIANTGFVCFSGFPREKDFSGPIARGFDKVCGVSGFVFLTGVDQYSAHADWDYFEVGVSKEVMRGWGKSFAGVSGGGIWTAPFFRKKGNPKGTEKIGPIVLVGVAFYEEEHPGPEGRFFVRTHGPVSLYNIFVPHIQRRLHN